MELFDQAVGALMPPQGPFAPVPSQDVRMEALEYLRGVAASNAMWDYALSRAEASHPAAVRQFCLSLMADRVDALVAAGDGAGLASLPLDELMAAIWAMVEAEADRAPQHILSKLAQVIVSVSKAQAAVSGSGYVTEVMFGRMLVPMVEHGSLGRTLFFLVACKELHQAVLDNELRRSGPDAALCGDILEHLRSSGFTSSLVSALISLCQSFASAPEVLVPALEVLAEVSGWVDDSLVVSEAVLSTVYTFLLADAKVAAVPAMAVLEVIVSRGMSAPAKLELLASLALPDLLSQMEFSPTVGPESGEFDLVVAAASLIKACTLTLSSSWFKLVSRANDASDGNAGPEFTNGDAAALARELLHAIFECLQLGLAFASAESPLVVKHPVSGALDFVGRFKRVAQQSSSHDHAVTFGLVLSDTMCQLFVALLEMAAVKAISPDWLVDDERTAALVAAGWVDEEHEDLCMQLQLLFQTIAVVAPSLTMAWLASRVGQALAADDRPVAAPLVDMVYKMGEIVKDDFAKLTAAGGMSANALNALPGVPEVSDIEAAAAAAGDAGLPLGKTQQHDCGAGFLVRTFLAIVESGLISAPEPYVKRVMYDVLTRYCSLLKYAPDTIAPVFLALLDERGIQYGIPFLAARFGALVVKMASELGTYIAPKLEVVIGQVFPLLSPSSLDEMSGAAPYVAEALGILIVNESLEMDPGARVDLVAQVLGTVVSVIQGAADGGSGGDEVVEVVSQFIYVTAVFSKAFTPDTYLTAPFMSAYEQVLGTVWSLGDAMIQSATLSSKLFSFVHCMVDTLGEGVLAGFDPLAQMLLVPPADAYSSGHVTGATSFVGLVQQVVQRYQGPMVVESLASLVPSMIDMARYAAVACPSGPFADRDPIAVFSEYEREVDGLIRAVLSCLSSSFNAGVGHLVVDAVYKDAQAAFGEAFTGLLQLAVPGATTSKRAALQLGVAIAQSPVPALHSTVFDTALPAAFSFITDPSLDLADARNSFLILGETAALVRALFVLDSESTVAWLREHMGHVVDQTFLRGLDPDTTGDRKWVKVFRSAAIAFVRSHQQQQQQ